VSYSQYLSVFNQCADLIGESVGVHQGRGFSGQRDTQYHLDLAADEVGLAVLQAAGLAIMSEESGITGEGDLVVVIDPIDGSTNCDRSIPIFSTSLGLLHHGELVMGFVRHHGTGQTYHAIRGEGAFRDGQRISTSGAVAMSDAIVAFSGWPNKHIGWSQHRALGSAAIELCLVADGSLDMFAVTSESKLHPWDYLGGMLIAQEAGAIVAEYDGLELVLAQAVPRRIVAAATASLADEVLAHGIL